MISVYNLQDMFIYDNALKVVVQEDWKTAQVDARAWINWTLADDIRTDLDSYLEGYVPFGGMGGFHPMRSMQ